MDHLGASFSSPQISTSVQVGYAHELRIIGCARRPAAVLASRGGGLGSHLSAHGMGQSQQLSTRQPREKALKPLLIAAANKPAYTEEIASAIDSALPILHPEGPAYTEEIASAIDSALPILHPEGLYEAMRYAVQGTHIYGYMCRCACELVGGKARLAMPMACAIEMWAANTLIQDDFPCLDNADMRRGRPATHKAFGESTAFLASTTLICAAFEYLVTCSMPGVGAETKLRLVQELARAGIRVGCGQYLDLLELLERAESDANLEKLVYMNTHKGATFFELPLVTGAIIGGASDEQIERLRKYGNYIGLIFTLMDDVADATMSTEEMGKNPGIDNRNKKRTFFNVLGHQKCLEMAADLSRKAKMQLSGFDNDTTVLIDLVDKFMVQGVTLNNPNYSSPA